MIHKEEKNVYAVTMLNRKKKAKQSKFDLIKFYETFIQLINVNYSTFHNVIKLYFLSFSSYSEKGNNLGVGETKNMRNTFIISLSYNHFFFSFFFV